MNAAPVSRRARPAKAPLSREVVLETGLRILDADGLSGLTMRRVAKELDTGAASLYVYVANRDDLMSGMLDHVLSTVPAPAEGDWRERLTTLVEDTVDVLARHEGLALVALGRFPATEHALGLVERLLALLRAGGLDPATAAWAVDLIYLHLTAAAAEQSAHDTAGAGRARYIAELGRRFDALPAERYPTLVALRAQVLAGDGDARARWALRALLNGIVATPVGAR
ncbi:TetR family transcriptional regulator [Nocardia neocaledoniensis NBRC 108232]|uniref:TetR family transcriptional regulator n=1 Tax=Nocardia neocaledoniensis TaxID=236511 RepID=A0A317NGR1_9NOCA|nr:TetR/AcrR family transcriptional regulator C-terminal domain-containing protein [Nocardia neocaledoniensis]PWV72858.1 TetR family transcriptional regulator [Nocardia neocaledoniensis]GEM32790.1 TetR family transcriptional regulator [Nocardia neocaledoniensis NBRC 108232]